MKISNNECTELGVIATITSQYYFKITTLKLRKIIFTYFMFVSVLLPCMDVCSAQGGHKGQ